MPAAVLHEPGQQVQENIAAPGAADVVAADLEPEQAQLLQDAAQVGDGAGHVAFFPGGDVP